MPKPATKQDLIAADAARDIAVCGQSLSAWQPTSHADKGAHDPTPTFYFVLEELFAHVAFSEESHLLDVGCGSGRVLAYFLEQGFPGRATGVELDANLARRCRAWTSRFPSVDVVEGDVLDLPFADYTDFYLFNPFDTFVLERFIPKVEREATGAVTVIHMSDNGETYSYLGRPGWQRLAEGRIRTHAGIAAYESPQHYTVWRFEPPAP
ncbi:class I SAM-dependent methyltransferase [Slackia heliotrinireducens]|uniref:class I SAM-dependent methyltransferase n=1 Tax=Slackia heliotrinireducens TaxID=84110 RepID=UPI00331523F5